MENIDKLVNKMKSLKVGEHKCQECGLGCLTAAGFRKHMRSKHAIDTDSHLKTFKCEKCGKGFIGKNYLTRHMKSTKCAEK